MKMLALLALFSSAANATSLQVDCRDGKPHQASAAVPSAADFSLWPVAKGVKLEFYTGKSSPIIPCDAGDICDEPIYDEYSPQGCSALLTGKILTLVLDGKTYTSSGRWNLSVTGSLKWNQPSGNGDTNDWGQTPELVCPAALRKLPYLGTSNGKANVEVNDYEIVTAADYAAHKFAAFSRDAGFGLKVRAADGSDLDVLLEVSGNGNLLPSMVSRRGGLFSPSLECFLN